MSCVQRIFTVCAYLVAMVFGEALAQASSSQESESPAPGEARAAGVETAGTPKQVSVFFATNRERVRVANPETVFGGQRGEPAFGTCEVEFKVIPGLQGVAQKMPFYVPTESSDQRIEVQVHPEAFWERLGSAMKATTSGDVVVFVHGYSYDFERACDRAAETQRVLDGKATVLMVTWPSNGRPTDYASDEKDLEWSVPFLQTVLRELSTRLGAENVQVLAHSLGSRGVVRAISELRNEGVAVPVVDQLVLLAPDLDSAGFLEEFADLEALSGDITLYASSNDTPLKVSRKVNGSPRLGEAGEYLTVVDGMETVDVTPAGRYQILGHEYFYYHPLVISDLLELVTTGRGAADRATPQPKSRDGLVYWEIVAEEEK